MMHVDCIVIEMVAIGRPLSVSGRMKAVKNDISQTRLVFNHALVPSFS
jgi:hypothetical protein